MAVDAGSAPGRSLGCVCSGISSPTQVNHRPGNTVQVSLRNIALRVSGLRLPVRMRVSHLLMRTPKSKLVTLTVPARLCFLGRGFATPWETMNCPSPTRWTQPQTSYSANPYLQLLFRTSETFTTKCCF